MIGIIKAITRMLTLYFKISFNCLCAIIPKSSRKKHRTPLKHPTISGEKPCHEAGSIIKPIKKPPTSKTTDLDVITDLNN